ncbi:hypothetical protein T484DRAFT_1862905 [Baffinella frigidus]|nr:hypothetical protein T484DRAFT_1862905 [Cryptophyta sp. CCMP2293]
MKGSAPRSPLLALAAAVLLARSAAAFSAPCALLQSPLLLRSPPRFSQQFALPELQDAARIRGGRSVEVGMVLNKLFGRGKDQAGKEGGVAENKYGVRFEAMLNSVQDYGEAEMGDVLDATTIADACKTDMWWR